MRGSAAAHVKALILALVVPGVLAGWPGSSRMVEAHDRSLRDMISTAASLTGVDPVLVAAVIAVESNYNPWAISRKGAMGLMQLMPQTARDYGVADPFDPHENIRGGVRHLGDLLRRYDGDLLLVLAAYNAGETAVATHGGLPPYKETRGYVRKVLTRYWRGEVPPRGSWEVPAAAARVGPAEGETPVLDGDHARRAGRLRLASPRPAWTDMGRPPLLVQTRKAPLVWVEGGPRGRGW